MQRYFDKCDEFRLVVIIKKRTRKPKQEYWSGLPLPFPGDLPDPGIEPMSPALAGGFFIAESQGRHI